MSWSVLRKWFGFCSSLTWWGVEIGEGFRGLKWSWLICQGAGFGRISVSTGTLFITPFQLVSVSSTPWTCYHAFSPTLTTRPSPLLPTSSHPPPSWSAPPPPISSAHPPLPAPTPRAVCATLPVVRRSFILVARRRFGVIIRTSMQVVRWVIFGVGNCYCYYYGMIFFCICFKMFL